MVANDAQGNDEREEHTNTVDKCVPRAYFCFIDIESYFEFKSESFSHSRSFEISQMI